MARWGIVGALGIAGASAGLAAAPPVAATGAQTPPASPPTETVTFDEPGAHTWTVPAGVVYATIDAYGGSGGGDEPGLGAHVQATVPVSRGDVYTVIVAGEGGNPDPVDGESFDGRLGGDGGFGGGAPGGFGGDDIPFEYTEPMPGRGGGGGGGASDVRTGSADASGLATRLIVAGGGGGSAASDDLRIRPPGLNIAAGGDGGRNGLPGEDGQYDTIAPVAPQVLPGGGGGTEPSGDGEPGENGFDAVLDVLEPQTAGNGGGGGGGGAFGGGGGESASAYRQQIAPVPGFVVRWYGSPSAGGGGSSLVPDDTVCPAIVEDGVHTGDGLVVITFHRGAAPPFICS